MSALLRELYCSFHSKLHRISFFSFFPTGLSLTWLFLFPFSLLCLGALVYCCQIHAWLATYVIIFSSVKLFKSIPAGLGNMLRQLTLLMVISELNRMWKHTKRMKTLSIFADIFVDILWSCRFLHAIYPLATLYM